MDRDLARNESHWVLAGIWGEVHARYRFDDPASFHELFWLQLQQSGITSRMKRERAAKGIRFSGIILILAFPALVYGCVFFTNSVNMPVGDDYFSILAFLARWQDAGRWSHLNIHLFLEQYYSHRIPLTRFIAALLCTLQGHCDLRILQATSWLGWILLLASIIASRWSSRAGLLWLLPASLIMMQPQGHTNMLIAAGSPGHAWTILFAFWAIHFSKPGPLAKNLLALGLAVGSALCTANGLLVFPVIALSNIIGRDGRRAAAWIAAGAATWTAYLWSYSIQQQPMAHHAFSLGQLFLNTAVMTGAVLKFGTMGVGSTAMIGAVLAAAAGVTVWVGRRDARSYAYFSLTLFLILSIIVTAVARIGWDAEYMMQDRYRLYGLALVALLYVRLVECAGTTRQRPVVLFSAIAALAFNVLSYAEAYGDMLYSRRWADAAAMSLQLGSRIPLPAFTLAEAVEARALLLRTVEGGLLRPPRLLNASGIQEIRDLAGYGTRDLQPPFPFSRSESVAGYIARPPSGVEHTAARVPAFGVIFLGKDPLVMPVLVFRARFAEIAPRRSFLSGRYAFVLPENVYERGDHLICAADRLPGGSVSVLWSAVAECP